MLPSLGNARQREGVIDQASLLCVPSRGCSRKGDRWKLSFCLRGGGGRQVRILHHYGSQRKATLGPGMPLFREQLPISFICPGTTAHCRFVCLVSFLQSHAREGLEDDSSARYRPRPLPMYDETRACTTWYELYPGTKMFLYILLPFNTFFVLHAYNCFINLKVGT